MKKAGKYEILRKIGTGGFGVVYEGRDPFIKRRVAIKTCTSEDEEMRQRFFREAEIAGNLEQKNIVTIFDFGFEDGVPYLVQEFLQGEDLDHKITRKDPLTVPQKLEILLQVAQGLSYAHARGVIHRDIKPGNIRVLEDARVKIMDFGIAKLADVESGLTKAGMTVGTAAYLPPEQIRGDRVDSRADIFSFGVVAYELLAYQRPFDGKTLSTLLYQILSQEPLPIGELWFEAPPRLAKLVMRCLEKDAADRPASFDVVVGELAAVLSESAGVEETLRIPQGAAPAPAAEPDAAAMGPFADRARAALAAGDLTAAELEITLAAKKFGEGAPFRRLIQPLRKELSERRDRREEERRRNERLRSLLERARKLTAQQSFEEARLALQAALEIEPGHAEARSLIDQAERALEAAERERALAADLAARRQRIERLAAEQDLEPAREALAEAQRAHGEQPFFDLEQRLERAARAQQIAALVAKSRDQLADGDAEEAAEMARRALAIDPESPAARQVLAEAEQELARRAEEAERQRQEAERARLEDRNRRRDAVAQSLGRGDFDAARRALADAIATHGAGETFAGLHRQLLAAERAAQVSALVRDAESCLHESDPDLAVEYARRALEVDGASRDAQDVLARAEAELRRRAQEAERERRIAEAQGQIDALLDRQAWDKAERALARAERELGAAALAAQRTALDTALAAQAAARAASERLQNQEAAAAAAARDAERARQAEAREREVAEREAERQRLAAEREAEKRREAEARAASAAQRDAERQQLAAAKEAERQRLAAEKEAERQRLGEARESARQREAVAQREREFERATQEISSLLDGGRLDKAERALERALSQFAEGEELAALRERLQAARTAAEQAAQRADGERANLERARALEAAAGAEIPSGSFAVPGGGRPAATRWAIAAGVALVAVAALVWVLVGGEEPASVTTTASAPQVSQPAASSQDVAPAPAVEMPPAPSTIEPAPPPPQETPVPIPGGPAETPSVSPAARWVEQGRARWQAGDAEGALRAFDEARRRDPQEPAAREGLAQIDREARRRLAAAKQRAIAGRADTLAPQAFRGAESEAARSGTLRDPTQAVRSAWRATDLYADALRDAEEQARRQAAAPPPVAVPVAPPTVSTPAPPASDPAPSPPAAERPVVERPPAAAVDESEGVRAALRRYEAAYESLDVAAVRAAWPALSDGDAQSLGRAFAGYQSLQMTLENCRVMVDGATATAACRLGQSIDVKVGNDLRSTQQVMFRLRKAGDAWTISGRSVQ